MNAKDYTLRKLKVAKLKLKFDLFTMRCETRQTIKNFEI